MARFKTKDGAEWDLSLTVDSLGELKRDAAFDLGDAAASGDRFGELLLGNPVTLGRVLWVMVREQAEKRGCDERDFAKKLDGEVLDAACDAFIEAVLFFFHRRRAPAIKPRLPALMAKVDRDVTAAMGAALDEILKPGAGNSPASPG